MKTPDETKKELECCAAGDCHECPYLGEGDIEDCAQAKAKDALAHFKKLETERHQLLTKNQQLERERDAAVADIRNSLNCCKFCKHDDGMHCKSDPKPIDRSCFEWRGVKEDKPNATL